MLTIYKYPLAIVQKNELRLPEGARITKIAMQGDQLCLWALGDIKRLTEKWIICVYGTGYPIDVSFSVPFIETVFDGSLVWHVFAEPARAIIDNGVEKLLNTMDKINPEIG